MGSIKDASARGRASRNRGARAEREIAEIFRTKYGYTDAHRGYTFHHESDVVGLKDIHCEVKRVEKLNVSNAMKQAVIEAEKRQDGMPTVFHKKNREDWLVTMRLDDWMKLYGAYYENSTNFH